MREHNKLFNLNSHVKHDTARVKLSFEIEKLLRKYPDYEKLRNNPAICYLHATPAIFNSLCNEEKISPSPPLSVQLEITNTCKTKCTICKRYSWQNEIEKEELNTFYIRKLILNLSSLGVKTVTISGGEPLLRSDFGEIIEYANNNGLKIGILTNGLNFTEQIAEAIIQHAGWVRISIDASNEQLYKKTRGVSGFTKVMKSFDLLKKSREKYSKSKCKIGICFVIQNLNINDIGNMISYAKGIDMNGLPIDTLVFKFAHGNNGFLCSRDQLKSLNENNLNNKSLLNDEFSNLQYLKKFINDYSSINDIAEGKPLKQFYKRNKIGCFTPYLFSLIDAFGDVYPCCFLYEDNKEFKKYQDIRGRSKLGNVKEIPFSKIWQSDRYQKIRSEWREVPIEKLPECAECSRHYLHNAFLTDLFEIYKDLAKKHGRKEGHNIFKEVVQDSKKFPPGIVWL